MVQNNAPINVFPGGGECGVTVEIDRKKYPDTRAFDQHHTPSMGGWQCRKMLFLNFTFYFATFYRHVLGLCHFQNAGLYAATMLVAMATKFCKVATNIFGGRILRLTHTHQSMIEET